MTKGSNKLWGRERARVVRYAGGLGRSWLPAILGVVLLAVLAPTAAAARTVWYVDDNAAGDPAPGDPAVSDPLEDGSAAHPFDAIQEGIDAAAVGDEVVLADGVYTGTGNKDLDFGGKDITVRSASGDASTCVIDCEEEGRGFDFHGGETAAAVVAGVTIRNGSAYPATLGGGISCRNNSNPTINDCILNENFAFGGGAGIFCEDSSPTLNDCAINDNYMGMGIGGGLACRNGRPTLNRCNIEGNSYCGVICLDQGNATFNDCSISMNCGYGVYCTYSNPIFNHCRINGNTTGDSGGGVHCEYSNPSFNHCAINRNDAFEGGGVSCYYSNPTLSHCEIRGNLARYEGGGLRYYGDSSARLDNCEISRNHSEQDGGGLYCDAAGNPILINCVVRDNSAYRRGGGVHCSGDQLAIHNTILWSNTPQAIYAIYGGETGPTVSYSDVQGGWPGAGNIDIDPLLTPDGHLRAGSPCLDAGDPEGDYAGQTDIDGEPRVIDGRVDIGADEWLDGDGDGLPDWWEALYFGAPSAAEPGADEDDDGRNNLAEYGGSTDPFVGPRTFHVNPAGDDRWDGRAPEWDGEHGPKATIQAAIDETHPYEGDEVAVAGGVYTGLGNKDLDFRGKALTVRGAGGPNACIIDCEANGRGFYFHGHETAAAVVAGLTIRNADVSAIYCCHQSNPTIDNCIISGNSNAGVSCFQSDPGLWNCTISHNSGNGVYCESGNPMLINCILWDNSGDGIYVYEGDPVVAFCDIQGGWPGTGNINIDPLLTPDGHLQAGSPCLDAGDPDGDYAGQTDIDGEPRVADGRVDIGADEWLDSDGDELPDWWETLYFDDPAAADPAADEDGDGRANLAEYIGGTNPLAGPRIYYVATVGDDAWDGLTPVWDWEHGPKATIQAAIDATAYYEGDEIVLADGTYTGPGNRDLDFYGRHITVRSAGGDPNVCVIDCEKSGRGFYFHNRETAESVLFGLTVRNGVTDDQGGGIACEFGVSPTISHCVISENHVVRSEGGGIYCTRSNPTFNACVIRGNYAGSGGGISIYHGLPILIDCVISGNSGEQGGGIYCSEGNPTFSNCAITENTASEEGGGLYCEWYSDAIVSNCLFSGNSSNKGGGVSCAHWSNPTFDGCTISGSLAYDGGGGLYNQNSDPTFKNCILWNNTPETFVVESGSPTVTYCDIQGGWSGLGNIDVDPLLTPDDHLRFDSPCRDMGNPAGIEPDQTDIDGEPRVSGECVDIGADEWLDSDADGLPDWWEIFYFGNPAAADAEADEDGDGRTNLCEYGSGTNPFVGPRSFYVNLTGNDDWDGLSPAWDGAHGPKATIQAAIDATHPYEGDEVVIADGVYTGAYNRDLDFYGKTITVRSAGDDPSACVIDCEAYERGFYFHHGETDMAVVAGLTIRNGSANLGGGVYCRNSSPRLYHCVISGNYAATNGGGVHCENSSPTFDRCTISGNSAARSGDGVYCDNSNPRFSRCGINGNDGGGVYFSYGNPTLSNCTINENGGCGVYSSYSIPILSNCTINKNYGGGFGCFYGSPILSNCTINGNYRPGDGGGIFYSGSGDMTLSNCTISGNFADNNGGGVYGSSRSPTFSNCTISGNSANRGGGFYCWFGSNPTLGNCILWGNAPQAIFVESGAPVAAYCDIQGGWPGTGNFDSDPLFIRNPDDGGDGWGDDPNTPDVDEGANDDYGDPRLSSGSPCIDAGNNTYVPADASDLDGDGDTSEPLPFDLGGDPRFFDDLGMPDTGDAGETGLPVVDMGAYEFQGVTCLGDITGNGSIDLNDLAVLLAHYGLTGVAYREGDLDGDKDVDLADLAMLLGRYGEVCP